MGFLAKPIGMLLTWMYDLIGNYGITLVVLTLIIKLALYPLYDKQIKSTANMSKIQPKMQEIQRKYANDKEMLNAKMAELYKEENFSPAGGCLPMIVQMIVIFGLFALLRNPIQYLGSSSEMLFAVHSNFLWMTDLAQPDKWILPIGAGIATYFSFSMSQSNGAMGAPTAPGMGGAEGMMKSMKYIFPIMIVLMGRTFPSGLTIYWALSQVIQIFYILRIKHVREKAENGGKKKKKGRK